MKQAIRWRQPVAVLRKHDDCGRLLGVTGVKGNLLTDAGMSRLVQIFAGEDIEGLHAESVRLGVGDSTAAADSSDTALSDGSNQWFEVLDDSYPVVNGPMVVYRATFGVDVANFTWACWGLDVSDSPPASSGDSPESLFNRKVFNFGVKDGGIWDLSVIVSFDG